MTFPFYPSLLVDTIAVVPYSRNSRTHSVDQIKQIARSIQEFGFTNPVLLDENRNLIAGHGRLEAARLLNIQQIPAITLPHLSDAQKQALRIADNRLALSAGWDDALLRTELTDLRDLGFDLSLTGFAADELSDILGGDIGIIGMPDLPDGDKSEYQQMTFTLHDDQAEQVDAALEAAKAMGSFDETVNENSNGNALARICAMFMSRHVDR